MWKRVLLGIVALFVVLVVVAVVTAPEETPAAQSTDEDLFGIRTQLASYTECGSQGEIPSLYEHRLLLTESLASLSGTVTDEWLEQRRQTVEYANERWEALGCSETSQASPIPTPEPTPCQTPDMHWYTDEFGMTSATQTPGSHLSSTVLGCPPPIQTPGPSTRNFDFIAAAYGAAFAAACEQPLIVRALGDLITLPGFEFQPWDEWTMIDLAPNGTLRTDRWNRPASNIYRVTGHVVIPGSRQAKPTTHSVGCDFLVNWEEEWVEVDSVSFGY